MANLKLIERPHSAKISPVLNQISLQILIKRTLEAKALGVLMVYLPVEIERIAFIRTALVRNDDFGIVK
jgi:hypothetical protein